METEKKKQLRRDLRAASLALVPILDGRHDLSQLLTLSMTDADLLLHHVRHALGRLKALTAQLTSEIGTDNLWGDR